MTLIKRILPLKFCSFMQAKQKTRIGSSILKPIKEIFCLELNEMKFKIKISLTFVLGACVYWFCSGAENLLEQHFGHI